MAKRRRKGRDGEEEEDEAAEAAKSAPERRKRKQNSKSAFSRKLQIVQTCSKQILPPRTRKARAGQKFDGPDARNLNISAPKVGADNLLEEILDPSNPEGAGEGAGVKGDACGRRQLLQQTFGGGSYCSRQPFCAWAHRTPNFFMRCFFFRKS